MSSQFGRLRQAVEKAENHARIQVFTEDVRAILDHYVVISAELAAHKQQAEAVVEADDASGNPSF